MDSYNSYVEQNFPHFIYDPVASLAIKFNNLSVQEGWFGKKSRNKHAHRVGFYKAAFEAHYPSGGNRLATWQKLCRDVGIEDVPCSNTQCRKAIQSVRINLVNLLDHLNDPQIPLRTFGTRKAFNEYTMEGRIFPKNIAKENVFVKALLECLF